LKTNKSSEAQKFFEIAVDSKSNIIKTGANAGLGICSENSGNLKEAASFYEKAATTAGDDNTKFKFLFYAGLCYEKNGDAQKSEQLYRDIIGENQFSEFANQAKSGLIRLGTIIE